MAPQEVFRGYPTNFQQKFSHGLAFSDLHCMLSSTVFQLIDSPGQMLVLRRFHSEMSVEFISFSSNLPFQQSTAVSRGMSIQVHFNDTDAFHWN